MKVQMEHALPRLLANIGDNAKTLQSQLLCHLCNDFKAVRYDCAVGSIHRSCRRDVLLGDHQKVCRRLRINVIKGIALLVLIDFV